METKIREAVMSQFEQKIDAGEALAEAIRAEEVAREAHAQATANVARARQHATRSGWTEAELKSLGLIPNVRAARTRAPRTPTTHETH